MSSATKDWVHVDPNLHDRFILRQRIRPVGNRYELSVAGEADEPVGAPFCLVDQKIFKLKEDIRFNRDDSGDTELMRIEARQRFDPAARYDVVASDGANIGQIQKDFGASLVRSTYRVFDPGGDEIAVATESNRVVAALRRMKLALDVIPIVGFVADLLPIPYHFVFERDGRRLGSHRRRLWMIRDEYLVDMSNDADRTVDRRLVLALAVGMDALQSR